MRIPSKKLVAAVSALTVCVVGVAVADGIPTTTPLRYTGVLQDSNGTAISTVQSMQLSLWDDATANASGNQKCVTPTQSITPDGQGRFAITLDQACLNSVRTNPNLWVQLQVGSTVLPRSKINAVPFAVEAGKATRVVLNGPGGTVRTTIDGTYCGATASTQGSFTAQAGALLNYKAAKYLCEQSCSSPTAHMCKGSEALTSYELGFTVPGGWVKGGFGIVAAASGSGNMQSHDCYGWTINTQTGAGYFLFGSYWEATAPNYVGADYCNATHPILCCD